MATLRTVVASGDRRASLEAIRDKLAVSLSRASARDSSALAGRLVAVIAELDGLPVKEGNPVDEINAKRAARRAAAQVRERA